MKLIIEDDEGRRTIVPFRGEQVTIGREEGNHVRLSEKNVSRKHARIVREAARYVVEDLKSFTGVRVNGEKVRGRREVRDGDLIQISEFDLILQMSPEELRSRPPLDDDDEATAVKRRAPAGDASDDTEARRRAGAAAADQEEPAERLGPPADLPPEDRPRLVGLAGALRGKEFVVARTLVSIGRAPENDVVVGEAPVSRTHCHLALVDGAWKVADAESRHGVQVNGAPHAQGPLLHGDVLELGGVPLLFAAAGQPVVLPPEPAPLPDAATARAAAPSGRGAAFGAGLSASAPARGKGLAVLGAGALSAVALAVFFATRGGHEAPVAIERAAPAVKAPIPAPASGSASASAPASEPVSASASAPASAPVSASAPASASATAPASASASASAPASTSAPAAPTSASSPASAPARAPAAAAAPGPAVDPDLEPRRLLNQGNQRMTAQDWSGAQESLEQALALKPGDAVLGNVYRSFAVLYSRQGRMEEGAKYYRLYLPYCQNPTERAALEKTLAEFEALPRGQAPAPR